MHNLCNPLTLTLCVSATRPSSTEIISCKGKRNVWSNHKRSLGSNQEHSQCTIHSLLSSSPPFHGKVTPKVGKTSLFL